jgi:hypothetical protein
VKAGRRPCEAIVRPSGAAHAQHPHGPFTTSSLLWPIFTGMETNEATSARAAMPTVADAREVA